MWGLLGWGHRCDLLTKSLSAFIFHKQGCPCFNVIKPGFACLFPRTQNCFLFRVFLLVSSLNLGLPSGACLSNRGCPGGLWIGLETTDSITPTSIPHLSPGNIGPGFAAGHITTGDVGGAELVARFRRYDY